ncbi:hypothetical protein [Paludibaculum fermentans]|uniref:hypothetical protein n=1 Tax=Paludibaculum fermentans TaxID=1473598 RepID=UPI003EB9839B
MAQALLEETVGIDCSFALPAGTLGLQQELRETWTEFLLASGLRPPSAVSNVDFRFSLAIEAEDIYADYEQIPDQGRVRTVYKTLRVGSRCTATARLRQGDVLLWSHKRGITSSPPTRVVFPTGVSSKIHDTCCGALGALLVDLTAEFRRPELSFAALRLAVSPSLLGKLACESITDADLLTTIALSHKSAAKEVAVMRITCDDHLAQIARGSDSDSIRSLAINRIADQNLLVVMARSAESYTARRTAVARLFDQSVLCDVATKDEYSSVRKEAVTRVIDQDVLCKIATIDAAAEVRSTALARIDKVDLLMQLAIDCPQPDVQVAAIARISEASCRAAIARRSSNPRVRVIAIESVSDLGELAEIARRDIEPSCRVVALRRLRDDTVIEEIARTDPDPSVRSEAVKHIPAAHQQLLFELALAEDIQKVRIEILNRITDEGLVRTIAKRGSSAQARNDAMNLIADEDVIYEYAKTDESLRYRAINRINDAALLRMLIDDSPDWGVEAQGWAVSRLHSEALAKVATDAPEANVRILAINSRRICDQAIIARISECDSDENVRLAAVEGVLWEGFRDTVRRVAMTDSSAAVRRAAVRCGILGDSTNLEIVGSDPDESVCCQAVDCLSDRSLLLVATQHTSRVVRLRALGRMSGKAVIEELQRKPLPEYYERLAFEFSIASSLDRSESRFAVRAWAASQVRDRACLETIVEEMAAAIPLGFGQQVLARIAGDSADGLRYSAIRNLFDPVLLARVARRSRDTAIRQVAVSRLSEGTDLGAIVRSDPEASVRHQAIDRLTDLSILEDIALTHEDQETRTWAERRVHEIRSRLG